MHARIFVAALAAAIVACIPAAARADLVTGQSVEVLTGGSGILSDNFFPLDLSNRVSALDGVVGIDVTSVSGNNTEEWFAIKYAPGNPAGELDFVIAPGADTSFTSLVHLDFYKAGDYSPDADLGKRASIDVFEVMLAGRVSHLRIDPGNLTLNGGMQAGDLAGYDSVRAIFRFEFANSSRLTIDFIANPEPGTMALFGLGAAGLGGLILRRRRARATAK